MNGPRRRRWHSGIVAFRARPVLVEHDIFTDRWAAGDISIVVLSDFHVAAPYASLARLRLTVAQSMALRPDLVVLAGDFLADRALAGRWAPAAHIISALEPLKAPLGVYAILGNHDWADCHLARATRFARNSVAEALEASHIDLLQNDARELVHDGQRFWLVGFDSQRPMPRDWRSGMHRPDLAFSRVPEGAFTVLAAHEPDYFAQGDLRAHVQISGHTHGGQVNLLGWRPIVPSQFGSRFAHGHQIDGDRHLVVSGGLGFSGLPVRLGAPPEITLIRIRAGLR